MDRPLRVAAFATSNRRGSLNRQLLERVSVALADQDTAVDVDPIDLRRYPLPLYDADVQARDGIPSGAVAMAGRISEADAVVIASPEYNGGYPALFKNTLDWVSRVDMLVFHPRYIGLVSASPGKTGGRRGLVHLAALFDNIFVTTHDEHFTLPAANDAFTDDGWVDAAQAGRLRGWVDGFVAAARSHAEARAAAA